MNLLTNYREPNSDGLVRLPSGLIVSDRVAEDYILRRRRPVAVDLFAGCGGFSCGVTQAGFDVIAAADNDTSATITYMANLGAYPSKFHFQSAEDEKRLERAILREWERQGKRRIDRTIISGIGWIKGQGLRGCEHFFFGDVRKLTGKQILDAIGMRRGEVDLVVGGPPCQGYSHAGKRNVMDPRNSLVFEFARLVCEIQPKAMVMENVPGIVNMASLKSGSFAAGMTSQYFEAHFPSTIFTNENRIPISIRH
jgi:DNA (cytosine-5)-methyltransferase 1